MTDNTHDSELREAVYLYGDLCAQFQSFTTIKTVEERNKKIREEGDKLLNLIHNKEIEARLDELRVPYTNGMFNKMGDVHYSHRKYILTKQLRELNHEYTR